MRKYFFWQWQSGREKHCGPERGVKFNNVFADNVRVSGPPFGKQLIIPTVANTRQVVDKRIKPDVDDLRWIDRQWNPPF